MVLLVTVLTARDFQWSEFNRFKKGVLLVDSITTALFLVFLAIWCLIVHAPWWFDLLVYLYVASGLLHMGFFWKYVTSEVDPLAVYQTVRDVDIL